MLETTADLLACPVCNSGLVLKADRDYAVKVLKHGAGEIEIREIEKGLLLCQGCGAQYKIRSGIPDFADTMAQNSRDDGDFWGRFYQFLYDSGIHNYVDIREPFHPFLPEVPSCSFKFEERQQVKDRVRFFPNDEYALLLDDSNVKELACKSSTVAEVGCGSGWLCVEAARRGCKVIGVDSGFRSLAVGKQYALAKHLFLDYVLGDGANPPFRARALDGIIAFHALHHFPDLDSVYQRYVRLLGPKGILAFYEHFARGAIHKAGERLSRWLIRRRKERLQLRTREAALRIPEAVTISRNEDVSIDQIGNAQEWFEQLAYAEYTHGFTDLAVYDHFLCDHNSRKSRQRYAVYSAFDRLLPRNFCLFVGRSRAGDSVANG